MKKDEHQFERRNLVMRKPKFNNEVSTLQLSNHYKSILEPFELTVIGKGLIKPSWKGCKSDAIFNDGYNLTREIYEDCKIQGRIQQMVLVKDIEIFSLCEHHLLPFFR